MKRMKANSAGIYYYESMTKFDGFWHLRGKQKQIKVN